MRLEPLGPRHYEALLEVALDPSLWEFTVSKIARPEDFRRYFDAALAERDRGASLPFATVLRATGRPIGSTRFGNIALEHQRAEIGWTWLGPAWQRTSANTEAKLLMLKHAFEGLGLRRVELKTSARNLRSRAAILRLGAVEEGTLRQHTVNEDGTIRDTVYFSILRDEWPAVKAGLVARLAGRR